MIDTETTLCRFLSSKFLIDFSDGVDRDTNLFAAGFIDSYGLVELIRFVETTYEVTLDNDDLVGPALMSVSAIVDTVARRQERQ